MLVHINEKKNLNFSDHLNILQACNIADVYVPRFCFHDKLSIAGNCRMCLVEVKGVLKPVASCAMPINKDMQIYTESKLVKKAREGILEFLLINHPLDCPICDQGGECDLQDQTLLYGNDKGRFYDLKRSVKDKYCGPLIKTIMTRCIQCTRCIRFMREISGLNYLGVIGRGNNMEISNFLEKSLFSELSGNVIDVCPVGALTSKPYSFVARPWELSSFNTIDLNDILQPNIRVDVRDTKILRVLPSFNTRLNENWISDSTRFSYDGFFINRLTTPYFNDNNKIYSCSWLNILILFKKIKYKKINFIVGDFIDIETIGILKNICNNFGNFSIINLTKNFINNDFRYNYIFNEFFFNNLNIFSSIFLFNTNLRLENPLLNLRIKKLSDKNLLKIFSLGSSFGYNHFVYNMGNNFKCFLNLLEGRSLLNNFLLKEKKTLLIFNWNFFNKNFNIDFSIIKNNILYFLKNNNIHFSILNYNSTAISLQELNLLNSINNFDDNSFFLKKKKDDNNLFFFLNIENFLLKQDSFLNKNKNFFIFQGLYNNLNDKFLNNMDFVLPSAHFIEKNASFINFFGLIQKVKFILLSNKNVRSDYKILFMLFKSVLKIKKFNIKIILNNYNLNNFILFFPKFKSILIFSLKNIFAINLVTNFYKANVLLKRSLIMLKCYKDMKNFYNNFV